MESWTKDKKERREGRKGERKERREGAREKQKKNRKKGERLKLVCGVPWDTCEDFAAVPVRLTEIRHETGAVRRGKRSAEGSRGRVNWQPTHRGWDSGPAWAT